MARDLTCPAADDKVGLKIDYLAKRLAAALAPQGFKRKGRNLLREVAEGLDRHWQIVNFQAGERNAGASGCCYVNLALQFPAIQRTLAARSDRAWLLDELDKVDEAYGQLRERLQNLLPEGHPLAGAEIAVRADEDLDALAAALIEAMALQGLPWLTRHASVAAVRDVDAGLLTADVDVRLAAALTLGDVAGAERLLQAHPRRFERVMPSYVEALRHWLEAAGVNCAALPAPGAVPVKDSWTLRQEAAEAAEDAHHAAQAATLAARLDGERPDPTLLAAAWIAEWRSRWRDEPAPLVDLPSGVRVAALAAPGREAVLLALLQTLVPLEARARRDPLHPNAAEFEVDDAVAVLLQALLPRLEGPRQVAALFERLMALQTRLSQDLVTARYPWGFARLAQWLARQPQDAALRSGMQAWLQALAASMPARLEAVTQALAAWHSRPLDPCAASHATQLELRAAWQAEAAAQDTAATQARIAAYPEQSLAADDKGAVQAWRRWLQRDPATGRLPVACEADDWGGPATQAWQQAEPALRDALAPTLQAWLEGLEVKPRTLTAIRQQVAALPLDLGAPWRAWVLARLRAFEITGGSTEWATTRMRPGVGGVLGDRSETLLSGLLLWSWADPGLPAEALAPVWSSLTRAAWARLPNHGARAPGVGRLGLRLLAGLDGPARDLVQAWAGAGDEKQRAKAAALALADPLSRP